MPPVDIFVGLLIATIPLVALARKADIPYPIVLVLGGLVLGFVPGLPRIQLDPNLVLLIFLPPLLYWESVSAPTDEMKANARWIWPLAVGLVLVTIAAVAAVGHALVPAMSWPVAVVLGAILAPTDELASVPIAERLGVPRHTTAIIDGESLLNDAGSLVIYTTAVGAVVAGAFSWGAAVLQFAGAALGAFAIGIAAGWLAVQAWKRFEDTQIQAVISVLLPFLAYVSANGVHVSGVLAVVTAGVFVNRYTPLVLTPSARLQMSGWWETSVFLINAVIFILVGMQLHAVGATALRHHSWTVLLLAALAVNVTIIAVRFAWIFVQGSLPWFRATSTHDDADWKHGVVTAASGFRGGVSLAAALAIPTVVASRAAFPERDLIVFLTFSVILVTLVGGGLLLPSLIRALRIPPDDVDADEEREAVRQIAEAALARLAQLESEGRVDGEQAEYLRDRYEARRERYADGDRKQRDEVARRRLDIERELIAAQRTRLVELRRAGTIENQVQRRVQLTLDMAESGELRAFNAGDPTDANGELGTRTPPPEPAAEPS